MERRVLPQARREIEVCLQDKRSSVSREKTHIVHQIGDNCTAQSHQMLDIGCEQQNFLAHDSNDENTSFVCANGQGFGAPPIADQCENLHTCALVDSAHRCTACASPCRFLCLLDSSREFGFFQMGLRNQRRVKIRSANEMPGVLARICHIALQDIDHPIRNIEFSVPASVVASTPGRVMSKSRTFICGCAQRIPPVCPPS